ncbi:MAG: hypothetical protein HGA99_01185 [Chlorobiaceae bacterium]|nr:hypothetical protein [Chlorobiaceae bacterium]
MSFIEIKEDGIYIDDEDIYEKYIIDSFVSLAGKKGFDCQVISSGVEPSPDFGYFALADRFWRASLCIYFSGTTNCFWESGTGYSEPWLFNARHAVELYIKGFLLNTVWLDKLQQNPFTTVRQTSLKLKEVFNSIEPHRLFSLYTEYHNRIECIIGNWNTEIISETLEISNLVLNQNAQEVLRELDEVDRTSFRFRYPSFKQERLDYVQKAGWNHDKDKLLPKTGLPIESSYFFDHIKVINSLHELVKDMKSIQEIFAYFNNFQDEQLSDYLRQLNDEICS